MHEFIGILEIWGAVITLALLVVTIGEIIRDHISPAKVYSILFIVALVILVWAGLCRPYHPIVGIALKWQGIVTTTITYIHLMAKRDNEEKGTSYLNTYAKFSLLAIAFWIVCWLLLKTKK